MSKQGTRTARRIGIGQGRGTRRQYKSKSSKLGNVSPAIVEKYLAGMRYPAKIEKLINNAQTKEAPHNVMTLLNKLPEKTYTSPIDIAKEIGKIE